MWRQIGLALALFQVSPSTHAQSMPKLDISHYCSEQAVTPGTTFDQSYALCVEVESSSFNILKENWNSYRKESRKSCLQGASGNLTYSNLQACIVSAESKLDTVGF